MTQTDALQMRELMTPEMQSYLEKTGVSDEIGFEPHHIRDLGDGTYVMAKPLLFHWMLIRGDFGDLVGYFDRWCYANVDMALQALAAFPQCPPADYEPAGWHKHPKTGRQRPGGDPTREYIAF